MFPYIVRRVLQSLLTLWIISVVTFVIAKATPGGPFGLDDPDQSVRMPQEMRDHYRQLYGLDQPVAIQYLRWLGGIVRGDFGVSYTYRNEHVQQVIGRTWPVTAQLGLGTLLLALGLGIPLGLGAATRRGSGLDHLSRVVAVLGAATPVYVLATLSVLIFSARLRLLPLTGWDTIGRAALIVPICVLALGPIAVITRYTRAATLEVLSAEFIRTARAKGLPPRQVIGRHVLKNALLPVLTLSGPLVAHLLTGSFFVETIFNIPGIGAAFVFAAADRDYPLIMAGAVLSGSLIILLNLAVDLAYGLLDPRIRFGAAD